MRTRYTVAETHHCTGAGWNRFRTPIHINASLTLALLQVSHCARALLLLQLGQDGGLTLREGWHLLQDSCLLEGIEVGVAILAPITSPVAPAPNSPARNPHQDVGAGNSTQSQVLHSPLLQLHICILQLAVTAQHVLNGSLYLWKEVHELDVGGQQECPGGDAAQVELGVEQVELDQRA